MSWIYTTTPSPVGELLLAGSSRALMAVRLPVPDSGAPAAPDPAWRRRAGAFAEARAQLDEYFAGRRRAFELRLEPGGTPFQLRVLAALLTIPYGETRSYAEVARGIGHPKASRAVGAANARNPLPIVIPCHRVIGANGQLTGFGGGLAAKRRLLDLERAAAS